MTPADMLEAGAAPIKVREYTVRNLRQVPSTQHQGEVSFIFDVLEDGEWRSYGPIVMGNWSVRSDIKDERFPASHVDERCFGKRYETVYLGWWALRDAWRAQNLGREERR